MIMKNKKTPLYYPLHTEYNNPCIKNKTVSYKICKSGVLLGYKIEDIKNAVAFIQEHHLVNIKSKKIQVNEKYFHLILFEKNKTKEIKRHCR